MTSLTKNLLLVSVAGLAAGSIIDFGGFDVIPAATVALPLGAVFFGLFLISFTLEKEVASFDLEEAQRFGLTRRNESGDAKCKNCGNCKCQSGKVL